MASAQHRIFVSHSHHDNEFGMKLAQDLRLALTDESAVFYDVMSGLHGGDRWWRKIVEELSARDVFLLLLSPDAMNSQYVLDELDIAWNERKLILPVHYRTCDIRADLKTRQIISFLAPKQYEAAYQEVLVALHLRIEAPIAPGKPTGTDPHNTPTTRLIHQMETAFTDHDWPDVIRKAEYLMKHLPESMTAQVYRWQGIALVEEGEEQQALEAFQTALALVSDRQERLTLLSDYTALLVRQKQWAKVLPRTREALRLAPQDAAWQAMQQQAQDQLAQSTPPQKQEQPGAEKPTPYPRKTKEQWFNEGNALYDLKRYEQALTTYEQAIRLDPNDTFAYHNKGLALEQLGKKSEAQLAFNKAKQLGYSG